MRKPSVPYETQLEIMKRYNEGVPRRILEREYDITKGVLTAIIVRSTRSFPETKANYELAEVFDRIWDENAELIEKMVYEGASDTQIADSIEGLSMSGVRSRRRKAGLPFVSEVRGKAIKEGITLPYAESRRQSAAYDEAFQKDVRELWEKGKNDKEISALLGKSVPIVHKCRKEVLNLPAVPRRAPKKLNYGDFSSVDPLDTSKVCDIGIINLINAIIDCYITDMRADRTGRPLNGMDRTPGYEAYEKKYMHSKKCIEYVRTMAELCDERNCTEDGYDRIQ